MGGSLQGAQPKNPQGLTVSDFWAVFRVKDKSFFGSRASCTTLLLSCELLSSCILNTFPPSNEAMVSEAAEEVLQASASLDVWLQRATHSVLRLFFLKVCSGLMLSGKRLPAFPCALAVLLILWLLFPECCFERLRSFFQRSLLSRLVFNFCQTD